MDKQMNEHEYCLHLEDLFEQIARYMRLPKTLRPSDIKRLIWENMESSKQQMTAIAGTLGLPNPEKQDPSAIIDAIRRIVEARHA